MENAADPIHAGSTIGLGMMRREMARKLPKAGYNVRGFDIQEHAAEALAALGVIAVGSPAEAARTADVVICMLPDTPQVEDIAYGSGGLRASPPSGRFIVDMSAISRAATRRIHSDLKKEGIAFRDAPVSGGPLGAKNASRSIMVGGDKDVFLRAERYFRGLGTTATYVGTAGSGQTVKLCNQLVRAIDVQAVCEALALGRASGVDLTELRPVLLGGSARPFGGLAHRFDAEGPSPGAGAAAGSFRSIAGDFPRHRTMSRCAGRWSRFRRKSGSFPYLSPGDESDRQLTEHPMLLHLDFGAVLSRWPLLLRGGVLTIELTFIATVLGLVIGVVGAIARRSHHRIPLIVSSIYVEAIRNTPFLVQIFLLYFGVARLGLKLPASLVAAGALTINVGAYATEIIRAGFDSISPKQIEAAEGLALSRVQIYWHIVMWPAIENVYPALTSQFVLLMLATSLTSQISVEELTGVAAFIESITYRAFSTYILLAVIYILLSLLVRFGFEVLGIVIFPRRRRLGGTF